MTELTQDKYCFEADLNDDTTVDLKLLVCNDAVHTPNYHSIRYTILPVCKYQPRTKIRHNVLASPMISCHNFDFYYVTF